MSDLIMSVQEIIDAAFGDHEFNTVNFKLVRTVLLVLSNHMRLLNRHVQVSNNSRSVHQTTSNMSVTELRIHATDVKKKKKAQRYSLKPAKDDPAACLPEGDIVCKSSTNSDAAAVERRERELRIINQVMVFTVVMRSDSHEEPSQTPTPMTSVHSITKDKLIIVGSRDRLPRIPVVTQEQFAELVSVVRELRARMDNAGRLEFPENAEFIKAFQEGASLTDAMAAFQLSARLTAVEKAVGQMASMITELARNTPGLDVSQYESLGDLVVRGDSKDGKSSKAGKSSEGQIAEQQWVLRRDQISLTPYTPQVTQKETNINEEKYISMSEEELPKDYVTQGELTEALEEISKEILEDMTESQERTKTANMKIEKTLNDIKRKLLSSLELGDRLHRLEVVVEEYVNRVIAIDTGLSAQVTSYQDQLQQMQHDLETGLNALEDSLANLGTDPEVIADLNNKFTTLQQDVENTVIDQKHLRMFQNSIAEDLASLWKQIEVIRDAKADREEVTDALRDKIGLEDLNGMVHVDHFDAVHGDLEMKIRSAYDKFNSQEVVWQRAINDLINAINDKCDWVNFHKLREDMSRHLNVVRDKVKALLDIVGEPRAFAVRKKLFRNTKCLSCNTAADLDMNVSVPCPALPALRRPDGAEAVDHPEEHGDQEICFEGRPIPHPIDQRAHMCQRYCGGSHTLMPVVPRAPQGMVVTRIDKHVSDTVGTDGKMYKTEIPVLRKPCLTCNAPQKIQKPKSAPEPLDSISSGLSTDFFRRNMAPQDSTCDDGSLAPPQLYED